MQVIRVLKWYVHVHAEQARNYIKGNDDRSKEGDLAENFVGPGALIDTIDRQLGQVVAVGP